MAVHARYTTPVAGIRTIKYFILSFLKVRFRGSFYFVWVGNEHVQGCIEYH